MNTKKPNKKPNWNTSKALIIEDRRREVAALRRRRLTMRQIQKALQEAGRVNPHTGTPWSLGVIKKDVDAIIAEAKAAAVRDITEHRAEILADYHELLRLAWAERRYEDARKVLKDMREMLGTDAPQVIVFEQMQEQMESALTALELEFMNEPATLERAYAALMGSGDRGTPPN